MNIKELVTTNRDFSEFKHDSTIFIKVVDNFKDQPILVAKYSKFKESGLDRMQVKNYSITKENGGWNNYFVYVSKKTFNTYFKMDQIRPTYKVKFKLKKGTNN